MHQELYYILKWIVSVFIYFSIISPECIIELTGRADRSWSVLICYRWFIHVAFYDWFTIKFISLYKLYTISHIDLWGVQGQLETRTVFLNESGVHCVMCEVTLWSCLPSAVGAAACGDLVSELEAGVSGGPGRQRGASVCGVLSPGSAHRGDPPVSPQTPPGQEHQLQLQQRSLLSPAVHVDTVLMFELHLCQQDRLTSPDWVWWADVAAACQSSCRATHSYLLQPPCLWNSWFRCVESWWRADQTSEFKCFSFCDWWGNIPTVLKNQQMMSHWVVFLTFTSQTSWNRRRRSSPADLGSVLLCAAAVNVVFSLRRNPVTDGVLCCCDLTVVPVDAENNEARRRLLRGVLQGRNPQMERWDRSSDIPDDVISR